MYAGRLLAARRSGLVRHQREVPSSREDLQYKTPTRSRRSNIDEKRPRIREKRPIWDPLSRVLCHRNLVTVINFVVLATLSWNTGVLIFNLLPTRQQRVSQSVRSSFKALNTRKSQLNTGFVKVRQASFRDKYPSTTLSQFGTFDAVYVITNPKCGQWEEIQRRANLAKLSVTKWPMVSWKSISLENPPVRLARNVRRRLNPRKRTTVKTLKRQLAYLDAHRRIWELVADKSLQRVLVLDDTFFPSKRLVASLPPTMSNVDIESIAQQKPWHVVQFRLIRALAHKKVPWSMNPVYHHAVVRTNASLGAGMYALSLNGARYLLDHVNEYRAPVDVEFGLLQAENSGFVALSGCNNDRVRPFCPEMVDVLEARESMECMWRRFWETKNINIFKNLMPM